MQFKDKKVSYVRCHNSLYIQYACFKVMMSSGTEMGKEILSNIDIFCIKNLIAIDFANNILFGFEHSCKYIILKCKGTRVLIPTSKRWEIYLGDIKQLFET